MKTTFTLALLAVAANFVQAQDNEPAPRLVESYTSAKAIDKVKPSFPTRAARKGSDGWVQLSYVIDTDGNVKDVVALENGGDKAFIKAAMNAVKQWKFEPATANGEAVEQCDNTIQMDFILSNGAGVSRKFNSAMFNGRNALSEGDLAGVQAALETMDNLKTTNITELFWRNHLAISLYNKTGELDKKHRAVVKARSSVKAVSLDDDQKARLNSYLLQEEFAYLANNARYSSALYTFDKLQKADPESASAYDDAIEKVKALVAGDKPIYVAGEIGERGRWDHYLVRRAFSIAQVQGRLDKLEVRCSRKYRSFTIAEQAQWQIPESWGQCNIHVLGEQNSKFTLVEVQTQEQKG